MGDLVAFVSCIVGTGLTHARHFYPPLLHTEKKGRRLTKSSRFERRFESRLSAFIGTFAVLGFLGTPAQFMGFFIFTFGHYYPPGVSVSEYSSRKEKFAKPLGRYKDRFTPPGGFSHRALACQSQSGYFKGNDGEIANTNENMRIAPME